MDYEIVLSAIQMQLGLDDNTKAAAVALYNQYLAKSKAEKVPDTKRLLRCAAYIACLQNPKCPTKITFSDFISKWSDIKKGKLVNCLQSIMCYINTTTDLQAQLSKLISNFAFAETMFKEYNEKFKRMNLVGSNSFIANLNKAIWLLYIVSKKIFINNNNEIIESMSAMIASISVVLSKQSNIKSVYSSTEKLCELFAINSKDFVSILQDSLSEFAICEANKAGINNSQEIYNEGCNVSTINEWFSKEYGTTIEPSRDFDERLLLSDKDESPHSPVMSHPFERQGNANVRCAPRKVENESLEVNIERSKKLLKFDNKDKEEAVPSETAQKPFKFPCIATPSPYGAKQFPITTPLTKVKEMNEWLNNSVKPVVVEKNKLGKILNGFLKKEGVNFSRVEELFRSYEGTYLNRNYY